jgi:hypothetical protein
MGGCERSLSAPARDPDSLIAASKRSHASGQDGPASWLAVLSGSPKADEGGTGARIS